VVLGLHLLSVLMGPTRSICLSYLLALWVSNWGQCGTVALVGYFRLVQDNTKVQLASFFSDLVGLNFVGRRHLVYVIDAVAGIGWWGFVRLGLLAQPEFGGNSMIILLHDLICCGLFICLSAFELSCD
jgi:hypothetical protein